MKFPDVTTAIVLEKRFPRKDGTYPIKLRVTYQREQKYYATKTSASIPEFEKIMGAKPRGKLRDLKILLNAIEENAIEMIENLPEFSFKDFEDAFLKKKSVKKQMVYEAYDAYIEQLNANDQIGNASMYASSKKSIQEFSKTKKLRFEQIDVDFLNRYEKYMIDAGKSYTTIGMYLRCLRKLFNDAIESGSLKRQLYPFGRNRYIIPSGQNVKKALNKAELKRLWEYEPIPETSEQFAKDMWFLSFFCNGININDLFRLKFKNISGNTISFYREKTKRTSKANRKLISIIITKPIQEILSRWQNQDNSPENYVLPYLDDAMNEARKKSVIKSKTKLINKFLKRIAQKVEIEENITTYYARHTFSTRLKQMGASTEFIGESIGHSNVRTTENYLDSFEDEVKKDFAQKLADL